MSAFRWITKPNDEPLNIVGGLIVFLLAFNVLVFLSPLREWGYFSTGGYGTDTRVGGLNFIIQLGILFFGALALNIAPARWMKAIMIVEGAAVLFAYGVLFAPIAIVALTAWFFVFRIPIPIKHRWILPVVILIGMGIFGATKIIKGPFSFSMFFTMRLMFYAWDQHQNEYPKKSLVDFFVYFLTAPLVFIYPYMLFIPPPGQYVEKLQPRLTEKRGRRVVMHLLLGLVMVGGTIASEILPSGAIHNPVGRWLLHYLYEIIFIGRIGHIVYALLLLHGVECHPPIRAPLLATDFGEMWNRLQIHQKEIQVALFYNPAIIKLRKMNRYAAISLAVFWTMFIGNFVIHVFARYMYTPSRFLPVLWSRGVFFAVGGAVLAATLSLQEWRRRKKRSIAKGALGRLYLIGCWIGTQIFTAWLMSLP